MPPPTFSQKVINITNKRLSKSAFFNTLTFDLEGMKLAEIKQDYALEHNLDAQDYIDDYNLHSANYGAVSTSYNQAVADEASLLTQFYATYTTQQSEVAQLSDSVPILFFPVKLETVFKQVGSNYELWVRIFPDEIVLDTHEEMLTQDEIDQGQQYWSSKIAATDDVSKVHAWDLLSRSYGAQRAAWVALQTTPTITSGVPTFPPLTPKSSSWTKQPLTRVLPDAFVINCYRSTTYTTPAYSVQGNYIPDEVKVGFDPSGTSPGFQHDPSTGEIIADPEVEWMIHFDAAVNNGMAVKIPITLNDYMNGFDRIIALGVKVTLTKEASQTRLQDLIKNHHYTDGFALLKQGTCTSNTENGNSGYSAKDPGNPVTYATECEGNLFTPVTAIRSKTDGQLLCEALGIDYDTLYHIFQSNGYDIRDAMNINNVLWQAAFGYYASTMLSADMDTASRDETRDFFADYVRSRGALPSIRSGIQPYGILPTSVFSRLHWTSGSQGAVLYENVNNYTAALAPIWADAATVIGNAISNTSQPDEASQIFLDVLAQNPVSVDRVQRLGFGPGYIWNNLVYNQDNGLRQEWYQGQQTRISNLQSSSGLPISTDAKILQMNFLPQHSNVNRPLVEGSGLSKKQTLPQVGEAGLNYLQILSQATFTQLRDENFSSFGAGGNTPLSDGMLYKFARNSLMLEYLEAAYKVLGVPEANRAEPELINLVDGPIQEGGNPNMPLSYGPSRWSTMLTPFSGYATIADYLDSTEAIGTAETINLQLAKDGLDGLAFVTTGDLELLTAEVMDSTCFRLDTWRLALVNQRLNSIRGISDGSNSRNMGIYLGAYGWVEDIRKSDRNNETAPSGNFQGTFYKDLNNQGYIHAPSLNQAATAAVLRSGYNTLANASQTSPLSVNISSERVRSAMGIMEGITNGQEISVLLGYEFERYMFENNSYTNAVNVQPAIINAYIDPYIDALRLAYPLKTTITQYGANTSTQPVQAPNVLDGQALIEDYKLSGLNAANMIMAKLGVTWHYQVTSAVGISVDWIMNVLDAVGDLTTTESVYQLVKGNFGNSGAVAEAISKGTYVPKVEVTDTPKSGVAASQKFTMHFEVNANPATGWSVASSTPIDRANAEPYLNRWIGQILGDPGQIQCYVDSDQLNSGTTISVAELDLQPIDLVFMANDELANDASELALRIRKAYRQKKNTVPRSAVITINFYSWTLKPTSVISFEEITPLLTRIRNMVTGCRSLKTTDYIPPTAADGVINYYDLNDFMVRSNVARNSLNTKSGTLENTVKALKLVNYSDTTKMHDVYDALVAISAFGLDQTAYEFKYGETQADYDAMISIGEAAVAEAKKRVASSIC